MNKDKKQNTNHSATFLVYPVSLIMCPVYSNSLIKIILDYFCSFQFNSTFHRVILATISRDFSSSVQCYHLWRIRGVHLVLPCNLTPYFSRVLIGQLLAFLYPRDQSAVVCTENVH